MFDFSQRYTVDGYPGIAWRAVRHDGVWNCLDEEFNEDADSVVCIMVGDDREFSFSVDELSPLTDDEFCHECGQVGCGHDGRELFSDPESRARLERLVDILAG
jgi:hypothetical protein